MRALRPLSIAFHGPRPAAAACGRLRSVLLGSVRALRPVARIRVPTGDGRLLAGRHRDCEINRGISVDGVVEVTTRVESWFLGKLPRRAIGVENAP